jgi:mercuric ion binding protein
MNKMLVTAAMGISLVASPTVHAGERTVTLAVKNMYCASCAPIVRRSLEAVPGVVTAVVSLRHQTAVVTYDDAKTDVNALTAATTRAGYPSSLTSGDPSRRGDLATTAESTANELRELPPSTTPGSRQEEEQSSSFASFFRRLLGAAFR